MVETAFPVSPHEASTVVVITTAGEDFSLAEARMMATMVYKRFGRNLEAASRAWSRMLENQHDVEGFYELLNPPAKGGA